MREVFQGDHRIADFPRPSDVISNRFDAGAVCYTAEVGEDFAGFLWLAFDGYEEDEVRCRYVFKEPQISAWDFDVYLEPRYRMSRMFVRLWDAANERLAREGVKWSFSRISAFNPASLSAHSGLGMRALRSATFVCIGRLQISFIGERPYLHISLTADSRPAIELAPPRVTAE